MIRTLSPLFVAHYHGNVRLFKYVTYLFRGFSVNYSYDREVNDYVHPIHAAAMFTRKVSSGLQVPVTLRKA